MESAETPLFFSLPAGVRMEAENAAKWLLDELASEARLQKKPLLPEEIWILSHPFWEFSDDLIPFVKATHNRAVLLVRNQIIRAVRTGQASYEIRAGLWVPKEWERKYELVYKTELPWFLSTVLQSAFLGNPLENENGPWTPNNGPTWHSEARMSERVDKSNDADPRKEERQNPSEEQKKVWSWLGPVIFFAVILAFTMFSVSQPNVEPVPVAYEGNLTFDGFSIEPLTDSGMCSADFSCTQLEVTALTDCALGVSVAVEYFDEAGTVVHAKEQDLPVISAGETRYIVLDPASIGAVRAEVIDIRCAQEQSF